MNDKNKKCVLKVFNFVKKLNSLNSAIFFKFRKKKFFFVLKCKQKEHVHNLKRRSEAPKKPRKKGARSALNF